MTLQWLLNWWNLIFLLPFALALLYLGLYTASGITFGDVDSDADFDADADIDHDLDADHGVDADHDVDADQDADADHDTDADQDADAGDSSHISPHLAVMSWLGIGKVPVSIVLMVCLLTWGVTGFLVNASLPDRGGHAALLSIPIAALCALLMTHTVVVLISRYLPLYETTAPRRHALLGSVGEVMLPVDQRFGMVSVRDGSGDLYQVPCRLDSSAGAVSKGRKVKLIAYNAKQGLFYVEPCEPAEEKALS